MSFTSRYQSTVPNFDYGTHCIIKEVELPQELRTKYADSVREEELYQKQLLSRKKATIRAFLYIKSIGIFVSSVFLIGWVALAIFGDGSNKFNTAIGGTLGVADLIYFIAGLITGVDGPLGFFMSPFGYKHSSYFDLERLADSLVDYYLTENGDGVKSFKQLKKEAKKRAEYIQFVKQLYHDAEFRTEFLKVYSEK